MMRKKVLYAIYSKAGFEFAWDITYKYMHLRINSLVRQNKIRCHNSKIDVLIMIMKDNDNIYFYLVT